MLVDTMEEYEIEDELDDSADSEANNNLLNNLNYEEVLKCFYRDDLGDADLYRKVFDGRFVYHVDKGRWYKYVGPHWEPDYKDEATRSAEVIVEIYKHFMSV
jgi:hypothetical protein